MKKRIMQQAESSSFSIGVTAVFQGGAKISVRPFQNLNTNADGSSEFDYNEGFFSSFYNRGGEVSGPALVNFLNNGLTEEISKFAPTRSVSNPETLDFQIPGYGEFEIQDGVNFVVLCLPCECSYANPESISLVRVGYPTVNIGSFPENSEDSMRLEIFQSVPSTKPAYIFDDVLNIYRWMYYLPVAKVTLGPEIEIVNYDIGFLEFGIFQAEIADINTVTTELPLQLLSSYY